LRLLVMTAKSPGFTPTQLATTKRSLADLRDELRRCENVETLWRITRGLHRELDIEQTAIRDIGGGELHSALRQVDAVITTPSTAMLEAMLCGLPVAILDYHNVPHYVNAAWRITCREQIPPVLEDLAEAPLPRMLFQDYCLHDALCCDTPALPRLAQLIEDMLLHRRNTLQAGERSLVFPHRMVQDAADHVSWPSEQFDLRRLYPHHSVFGRTDVVATQSELEAALGTVERLDEKLEVLTRRLHRVPGYQFAKRLRKFFVRRRGF
jgi:hypothetical protein